MAASIAARRVGRAAARRCGRSRNTRPSRAGASPSGRTARPWTVPRRAPRPRVGVGRQVFDHGADAHRRPARELQGLADRRVAAGVLAGHGAGQHHPVGLLHRRLGVAGDGGSGTEGEEIRIDPGHRVAGRPRPWRCAGRASPAPRGRTARPAGNPASAPARPAGRSRWSRSACRRTPRTAARGRGCSGRLSSSWMNRAASSCRPWPPPGRRSRSARRAGCARGCARWRRGCWRP